jgi:hypothetical protein
LEFADKSNSNQLLQLHLVQPQRKIWGIREQLKINGLEGIGINIAFWRQLNQALASAKRTDSIWRLERRRGIRHSWRAGRKRTASGIREREENLTGGYNERETNKALTSAKREQEEKN